MDNSFFLTPLDTLTQYSTWAKPTIDGIFHLFNACSYQLPPKARKAESMLWMGGWGLGGGCLFSPSITRTGKHMLFYCFEAQTHMGIIWQFPLGRVSPSCVSRLYPGLSWPHVTNRSLLAHEEITTCLQVLCSCFNFNIFLERQTNIAFDFPIKTCHQGNSHLAPVGVMKGGLAYH